MAGVSTPAMAAAVSNAGGLGFVPVGAVNAAEAERLIGETRRLTDRPIGVNVFCHRPAVHRPHVESAWALRMAEVFAHFGTRPPAKLREIYTSFLADEAMQAAVVRMRAEVVSFHFGLPPAHIVAELKNVGSVLLATVTSVREAQLAREAGVDAVVAQGYEAGGHRGMFDADAVDDRLATMALVRVLAAKQPLTVIAAGGIMDGAGVAAALKLGAVAVQLGTAFIACPESAADAGFRAALASEAAHHTTMTRVISGRPARCLANEFTRWGEGVCDEEVPDYPIAYDAGKALNATARAKGDYGFGAQWAGQGAPLSRAMPAGELVKVIARELNE